MELELLPLTNLPIRLGILAVLLLPIPFIPELSWWMRLLACVLPLIFTGTYRRSRVIETSFQSQFRFAFIPFPVQKCKLAVVGFVETVYGASQPGIWTFILFGPLQFVLGWIFDYLIPALGGPYEIWLVTAKGREILAWQGHNQNYFEANLELLQNQTGAEIRGRSVSI